MGKKEKIGFIGLGKMGNPMSRRIIDAGYSLRVFDIVEGKVKELVAHGAQAADSPRALATNADAIISMIPDDAVLEAVSSGPNGMLQGAKAATVYIDMSTVSPVASGRVAEEAEKKGIRYLRAPVSGSTALAAAGNLTILASGPKDAYDKCADILGAMGQKTFYVGEGDESRYLKLLLNMMGGIISAMTAEALTFGKRGGMDWNQMIDIISGSVVSSPMFNYKTELLKERNFSPAFTAAQMAKDFDIALETGRAMNLPMPITSMVRQFFAAMKAREKGELDFFGLVTLMEELAGIES